MLDLDYSATRKDNKYGLRKSCSSLLKYQLDPMAWILPAEFNAIKSYVRCIGRHATLQGEVDVRFVSLISPFDSTQRPVCERKSHAIHLDYQLDPMLWVLSGKFIPTKNYACCNGRLTTLPGKTNVRFTTLLSPFDRTKGPVCGGKVDHFT